MKKFKFTLQQWYDMQTSTEKQHKHQLGLIQARLANIRAEMQTLVQSFDRINEDYCAELAKGIKASRAADYGCFFETTKVKMAMVQAHMDKLEHEKEQWLQKLVRIRKELKLLDKLRDKQYKAYLDDVKKEQGRLVDELVSYKVTVS